MSQNHIKQFETKMLCMKNFREKLTEVEGSGIWWDCIAHRCDEVGTDMSCRRTYIPSTWSDFQLYLRNEHIFSQPIQSNL